MEAKKVADILVIDDNQHQLDFLTHLLEANGYKTATLQQSPDAFKTVTSLKPRLILLDILMPKMDGFSVLKKIRHSEETKDIPVIIYSGKNYDVDKKRAFELGANAFIEKPAKGDELLDEIKKHI